MLTTAGAFLIIIWPGHYYPPDPYPTQAACEQVLDNLMRAGHELMPSIPGFKAWCDPAGPALTS